MIYQKQVDHGDGIVEIEVIPAEDFHRHQFEKRIDRMAARAMTEIGLLYQNAIDSLMPKPRYGFDLERGLFEQNQLLARHRNALDNLSNQQRMTNLGLLGCMGAGAAAALLGGR